MRNKLLFSSALVATLSAISSEAKTIVTPFARMPNPANYYSATSRVVPGTSAHTSDILSLVYPGAYRLDVADGKLDIGKPSIKFLFDFRAISHVIKREIPTAQSGQGVIEPKSDILAPAASTSPSPERTRVKHFPRKSEIKENVASLDDFVRRQREGHRKQLASVIKRRSPGRQFVLPLDHNSVRVCIAARSARPPLAARRLIPRHGIAAKYATPLTKADIERKNEHAREYRLAYARKSRHLRKLSPDMIARFKFYPPLRRFDTDVLVVAAAPTQPIIAYVPAPIEERVMYAATPAAGVQNSIGAVASPNDDIIGMPSTDYNVSNIVQNGNMPSKTGINGIFYGATDLVTVGSKAYNGSFTQQVALRNMPRGGLHQVTYDELGHSPPVYRA